MYSNHHTIAGSKIRCVILRCSSSELRIEASKTIENGDELPLIKRRNVIGMVVGVSSLLLSSLDANGAGLRPEEKPKLCDDNCEKELENVPMVTTESGLQYKDIKVGKGPSPPVGYQLAFPKGLTSAPGRPRVAPSSPVIFDVSLEYIPGLEAEEE
ncbi:hypothetical protein C3L33_17649, partial [Rhododendron williamsianum]